MARLWNEQGAFGAKIKEETICTRDCVQSTSDLYPVFLFNWSDYDNFKKIVLRGQDPYDRSRLSRRDWTRIEATDWKRLSWRPQQTIF